MPRPLLPLLLPLLLLGAAVLVLLYEPRAGEGTRGEASLARPSPAAAGSKAPRRDAIGPAALAMPEDPAPSPLRAESRLVRIVGRVVAAPRGGGVRDAVVVLRRRDGLAVRTQCDAAGRFSAELRIAPPLEGALQAQALPPPGFAAAGAVTVGEPQLIDGEELVLTLEPGRSATVAGRVLYARTGEPIPSVSVVVTQPGSDLVEEVPVERGGAFATTLGFPPGALAFEVLDRLRGHQGEAAPTLGRAQAEHLLPGAPRLHELELDVGPTIDLAGTFGSSFPSGSLLARIVARSPRDGWAGELDPRGSSISLADPRSRPDPLLVRRVEARAETIARAGFDVPRDAASLARPLSEAQEWSWQPVATDASGHARVRWTGREHDPRSELFPVLELRDAGGAWLGSAELARTWGHPPDAVPVDLRAVGSATGRVLLSGHAADGWGMAGVAIALHARDDAEHPPFLTRTDAEGSFGFEGVPVGLWELTVTPSDRFGLIEPVHIRQGANPIQPVHFTPDPQLGRVEGSLLLPAGVSPPLLLLESRDGPGFSVPLQLDWHRSPRGGELLRLPFESDRVPFGDYELLAIGIGGAPAAWRPQRQPLRVPAAGLTLRWDEGFADDAVVVRAVDATGERISGAGVWFGPVGPWLGGIPLDLPRTLGRPDEGGGLWTVVARGMRPTRVDPATAHRDGEQLVLEARLEAGWGATLVFREARGSSGVDPRNSRRQPLADRPLEGVGVTLDQRFARRSDRDGVVHLEAGRPPERIRLRYPGWEVAQVEHLSALGIPRWALAVVRLRPVAEKSHGR